MFRNMFSFPRSVGSALILSLSVMVSGQVSAAPITMQFDFTATGFPAAAPFDSVMGLVTVTFDPDPMAATVIDVTTGITLNSLDIDLAPPIAFSYDPVSDNLLIGGLLGTVEVVSPNTADFSVRFTDASKPTPMATSLSYATLDSGVFTTSTVSVTSTLLTPPTLAVAEPGTVAIFGLSLVGLGYMRRRRVA